ncbi:hypothetical protein ACFO25_06695 [Paenactinomyces guangxiensis]|uniref:Uncharacterized protein n=1 Tax=Paenactinomyces guangxiensis TaxID=1490290 RepID=A0A7W2A6D9_9BACL|nr:hypothetical protein [Paenactinomyces guangxiensis]MBA4493261.1 hypothetical protein [Paenactinomyces guangxiensis]MBH8589888.1 hypothetical protein [Paenactinomyces guangxiensis]
MPLNVFAKGAIQDKKHKKDLEIAKEYLEKSSDGLTIGFSELLGKSISMDDAEKVISNYYEKNPVPKGILNNPDLLSEIASKEKANEDFIIYEDMKNGQQHRDNGEVFIFDRKGGGKIGVYISKHGGTSLSELAVSGASGINSDGVGTMATTGVRSTLCVATNGYGAKMFDLSAIGNFWYNGSSSSITSHDGLFHRYFWGSSLTISNVSTGNMRTVYTGGYRYSEVYSRAYVETTIPLEWGNIVVGSGTYEASVGVTVSGNVYGRCIRL